MVSEGVRTVQDIARQFNIYFLTDIRVTAMVSEGVRTVQDIARQFNIYFLTDIRVTAMVSEGVRTVQDIARQFNIYFLTDIRATAMVSEGALQCFAMHGNPTFSSSLSHGSESARTTQDNAQRFTINFTSSLTHG